MSLLHRHVAPLPQKQPPRVVHAFRQDHPVRRGDVALCGFRVVEPRGNKNANDLDCCVCADLLGWGEF